MTERDRILLMASLIAAVRTARAEGREFEGALSPRVAAGIFEGLRLARLITERYDRDEVNRLRCESATKPAPTD